MVKYFKLTERKEIMEHEFDFEEMTDEQIEEYLDAIIETTFEPALEEAKKPHIMNPNRYKEFIWAYKAIKHALKDSGTVVTAKKDEDISEMGVIEIPNVTNVVFKNPRILYNVGNLADNFCVIPKTNNTFYMSFTFYGLTDLITEWEDNN